MIKRNPRIVKRNIEIWKPVPGFSCYTISNMGRVKSLNRSVERSVHGNFSHRERILKIQKNHNGYSQVDLYLKNKRKGAKVHSLVIENFGLPKPFPKYECNHKDGDKSNNWDTNLEWMTRKQNVQHAIINGLRGVK